MKTQKLKLAGKSAAPFYFEPLPPLGTLLTNDWGGWAFLNDTDFPSFLAGNISEGHARFQELAAGGFLLRPSDFISCSDKYAKLNASVFKGVALHIIIPTIRCNQKCVYCHASAKGAGEKNYDMDKETARKTVDFILSSPRESMDIEFQGGEPLLNWDVVKFTVEYARTRAAELKKTVGLKLVSNLSAMDEEKLRFIFQNRIALGTSIDGPARIHDAQRIYTGGSGHANVVKWMKKFNAARPAYLKSGNIYRIHAMATVTRKMLSKPRELVDEYLRLGLREIYPRPLNPFGFTSDNWRKIGYTAAEYMAFYRELLEYLIELNGRGVKIREKTAQTFLTKILGGEDPAHMDCRLMCGAGIGQLAYNYNGDIYTCDEGRMLAVMGDESFKIGNVSVSSYAGIIDNPVVKTTCLSSCLESLPGCSDCVFKPFCGVCPVNSYFLGGLFPQKANDSRCAINKGVLKLLFEKLASEDPRAVLGTWLNAEWYRDRPAAKKADSNV